MLEPVFSTSDPRGWRYHLEGKLPLRPIPRLVEEGTGAAHPDRFQHVFADRVYGACVGMTPKRLSHAAVSVRVPMSFDGALVATYKVVQDVLEDRAGVLRPDDNSLRVPEFYIGRDNSGDSIAVTLLDLRHGEIHSREFVATPQPYRVPIDTRHGERFSHNRLLTAAAYLEDSREVGSLIRPAEGGSLPVGQLTDSILQGCHLNVTVYGLDPKRDLDNCVLALMDAIQAARELEQGECSSIDRLVGRINAVSLLGRKGAHLSIMQRTETRKTTSFR